MKTAREMLLDHQDTFWNTRSVSDCDRWMAKDCQLRAAIMFENAGGSTTANKQRYEEARHYLGLKHEDQLYA